MHPTFVKYVALLFALVGCQALPLQGCQQAQSRNEQPISAKPEPYLVKAEKLGEYTPEQISERFTSLPQLELLTRYPVSVYRLVYRTQTADGKFTQASGALLVPNAKSALPILSQQHGTIENDRSAPSNYN